MRSLPGTDAFSVPLDPVLEHCAIGPGSLDLDLGRPRSQCRALTHEQRQGCLAERILRYVSLGGPAGSVSGGFDASSLGRLPDSVAQAVEAVAPEALASELVNGPLARVAGRSTATCGCFGLAYF